MDFNGLKYLIVGSGFYGAVIAERIANELKEKVLVIDRRDHIGGNSYSYADAETNAEIHKYGSHIFHTSNEEVWAYINRFTTFNSYQHRVLTKYENKTYSMPINLMTINSYYGKNLNPVEGEAFIKSEIERDHIENPQNLEEKAISLIGRPLYEAFIKGYTKKQWETDLTKLPANIITRLPVRFSYNDRYFNDKYEGLPVDGYGKIFEKMLDHELITTKLGVDFFDIQKQIPKDCLVIYTGPIDKYFNYQFGSLGWRTTDFEQQTVDTKDFQGTSVMNYAGEDVPYTRIHEFKHFHPERKQSDTKTVIFKEYSRFAKENDVPYYPINTDKDKEIFAQYKALAKDEKNVIFGGRLGNYVYVDMHQAIAMALNTFDSKIKNGQWRQ
ncbi:UDP-galactopyranose mutase [Bdellovibrio sp. HCB290]|uniref:UDP-galactopyranose mutase n=1 Tax=Bdellovibrio sp. HCB290 TaxID=3394356 RepID=UPI0039B62865